MAVRGSLSESMKMVAGMKTRRLRKLLNGINKISSSLFGQGEERSDAEEGSDAVVKPEDRGIGDLWIMVGRPKVCRGGWS